jgi:hypothetical protein
MRKPLLHDQLTRNPIAHPVEFGRPVACLADQHDPRVADPGQQPIELGGFN